MRVLVGFVGASSFSRWRRWLSGGAVCALEEDKLRCKCQLLQVRFIVGVTATTCCWFVFISTIMMMTPRASLMRRIPSPCETLGLWMDSVNETTLFHFGFIYALLKLSYAMIIVKRVRRSVPLHTGVRCASRSCTLATIPPLCFTAGISSQTPPRPRSSRTVCTPTKCTRRH